MAENAIISDLEFAPQLTDDMVFAVEDAKNTYSSTLGMLRGQLNKIFVERKDVDFNTLTDDGFYQVSGNLTNAPVTGSITWLVQVVKDASTIVQIVFGLDTVNYLRNFARRWNGSTWTSWDVIGGKIIQSLSSSTTDIPSSKAVQDAVNTKQGTITGGATSIVSNNLTASRALVSDGSGKVAVSPVTSTELGFLDGVTSSVQNQLNGKQATVTGAATTITSANLTANRALIANGSGKVAVSAVTSTELGYLDGVTSAIQTQLNGKANTALSNVASNIDYVVEKGGDEKKWYRKYKSGWLEQGGYVSEPAKVDTDGPQGTFTITLSKPYRNTYYNISGGILLNSDSEFAAINFSDRTTTNFKAYTNRGLWFRTCGFSA